jgi:hypothetical protein
LRGKRGGAGGPVLDTIRDRLAAAERAGHGDEDFSVLLKMLQR